MNNISQPTASPLPQFVRDLLASPPARGGGLNLWLYRVARVLHHCRSAAQIAQLLAAATAGQPVKRGEIDAPSKIAQPRHGSRVNV